MNIAYLWTQSSGYMAACVRALADIAGINVTYVCWHADIDAPFSSLNYGGTDSHELSKTEKNSYVRIRNILRSARPDVVVMAGWRHSTYVQTMFDRSLSGTRFVLGVDTPIRFDLRQMFAKVKLRRIIQRVDGWCVPGERGYQLMRYWQVPEKKVFRLLYGIDDRHFGAIASARETEAAGWPKRFLFVGRYVREKGIDVLFQAYSLYRSRVPDPWALDVCGAGKLPPAINALPGLRDLGFVQPIDLAAVYGQAGVFILPSRAEPWGQVLVEAGTSGLPLLCTQQCGAAAEVVRDFHNGFLVPKDDPKRLADAMEWLHRHPSRLPEMGIASRALAAPYAAERWAENQLAMARRLCAL